MAIRLFDANQLEPAVAKFAKIVDLHPSDEVSQYYLAVALFRLGKTDQAYIHFTLAYLSEPDSQAGKYSKLAIDRLDSARTRAMAAVANGGKDEAAGEHNPPSDQPSAVIKRILRQTDERTVFANRDYETFSIQASERDGGALAKFSAQAEKEVEYMKNAAGEAGRVYTNDQVMQAQRNYDERKTQLEYLRKSSAVGIQSAAEHQALALQQSAEYVEDQIIGVPSKRSSLRLSPVGTNLYVRTYVNSKTPTAPPAELLADQDRLLLVATHNKQGELTADQDKLLLKKKSHPETLTVSGRLIRR